MSILYCRVFIPNQSIVKQGEYFSELYMIFKGKVTLSLSVKDENEYFTLYTSNFFGDYQILLGLKSTECYKASSTSHTYCQCIKKSSLLDLMSTFLVAHSIFTDRATKRRIEFRRIKKQFEKFADVNPDSVIDQKNVMDPSKFTIKYYSDNSKEQDMPPFLNDPDFYFTKADIIKVPLETLENVSDSE